MSDFETIVLRHEIVYRYRNIKYRLTISFSFLHFRSWEWTYSWPGWQLRIPIKTQLTLDMFTDPCKEFISYRLQWCLRFLSIHDFLELLSHETNVQRLAPIPMGQGHKGSEMVGIESLSDLQNYDAFPFNFVSTLLWEVRKWAKDLRSDCPGCCPQKGRGWVLGTPQICLLFFPSCRFPHCFRYSTTCIIWGCEIEGLATAMKNARNPNPTGELFLFIALRKGTSWYAGP